MFAGYRPVVAALWCALLAGLSGCGGAGKPSASDVDGDWRGTDSVPADGRRSDAAWDTTGDADHRPCRPTCSAEGQAIPCGSDGCGGVCGACDEGLYCDVSGPVPLCRPVVPTPPTCFETLELRGSAGGTCDTTADCVSGYCIQIVGEASRTCICPCVSECPVGFECRFIETGAPEEVFGCLRSDCPMSCDGLECGSTCAGQSCGTCHGQCERCLEGACFVAPTGARCQTVACTEEEFPGMPGEAGQACSAGSDCDSGLCVDVVDGRVCSMDTAQGECPEGWDALVVELQAPDVVFACVPLAAHTCWPCNVDEECIGGGHCMDYGPAGKFCGSNCSCNDDCLEGFVCQPVEPSQWGTPGFCVLASPETDCFCTPTARDLELTTECYRENTFGRCHGSRHCGPLGLTPCDAPEPQLESCNGLDDDCDGTIDESSCDDGNPCTEDVCIPGSGCEHKGTCPAPPPQEPIRPASRPWRPMSCAHVRPRPPTLFDPEDQTVGQHQRPEQGRPGAQADLAREQ